MSPFRERPLTYCHFCCPRNEYKHRIQTRKFLRLITVSALYIKESVGIFKTRQTKSLHNVFFSKSWWTLVLLRKFRLKIHYHV